MRVLLVAEHATLAQITRLAVLGRALAADGDVVHFACASFPELVFANTPFVRWPLDSIASERVARRVARGGRPWTLRVLARYLRDDLALLARVRPDAVIGDLRLSLSTSAPLAGVRHLALANAYWRPEAAPDFPVPDHPIVKWLGPERAGRLFARALPAVLRRAAGPMNALRRRHRLPPLGDLRHVLTHGDRTLYADPAAFWPGALLRTSERFVGPLSWSPRIAVPDWWHGIDRRRPIVYVTLGSSGRAGLLPLVARALADLGLVVIAATAGRATVPRHERIFAADYLPGELAARRARFVVTNGGCSTGYQALGEGRPLLALPWNFDQYLATQALERAGVCVSVRAGAASMGAIRAAALRLLEDGRFASRAESVAPEMSRIDPLVEVRRALA